MKNPKNRQIPVRPRKFPWCTVANQSKEPMVNNHTTVTQKSGSAAKANRAIKNLFNSSFMSV